MSKLVNYNIPTYAMRQESSEDELLGTHRSAASYRQQRLKGEYNEAKVDEVQTVATVETLAFSH